MGRQLKHHKPRPTPAERYEAAARIVESGWCRYSYAVDAEGAPVTAGSPEARRHCAIGALAAVAAPWGICGSFESAREQVPTLLEAIGLRPSDGTRHDPEGTVWSDDGGTVEYRCDSTVEIEDIVTGWNDDDRRTADEVAGAFRRAAEIERSRQDA